MMDGVALEWYAGDRVPHAELLPLINAAFAIYPFSSEPRLASVPVFEEQTGPTASFVVARVGGTAVGCAMICPTVGKAWDVGEGRGITSPEALYLGLAAVSPALRKGGIGKALLAEAEHEASRRGFSRIVLGTVAEMGNVTYYAALGYRSVDTRHFEAGHWGLRIPHEVHVMEKRLPMHRS